MEAHCRRAIPRMALAFVIPSLIFAACSSPTFAAGYRTTNFVVNAPTPQLAKEIGDAAEQYRKQLAIEWVGEEMPSWSKPCPITAQVQPNLGAGGKTSFVFDRGEVFNWSMEIQGTRERVLDSVLPHEVTHTIFASYFRCPLPRWADEGACTTMEHRSEVSKQERSLIEYLKTGRGIPFSQMFAMKDYPRDVLPLYAQGHSLALWMIEAKGKREFVDFLKDGMQDENWPRAVNAHYGYTDLYTMQNAWLDWVKQGRPDITPTGGAGAVLASHTTPDRGLGGGKEIFRGQSPDNDIRPIGVSGPKEPAKLVAANEPVSPQSQSVYAAMAIKAKANSEVVKVPAATAAQGGSVYDASLNGATIRR
jgi:hypothetical protein